MGYRFFVSLLSQFLDPFSVTALNGLLHFLKPLVRPALFYLIKVFGPLS
jgi:hypothetical protein